MGVFDLCKGYGWECVECGERIPFSEESLMRLHTCVKSEEIELLPLAEPKPPVNLKVEFAHGVTHYFPKVDALTFADFDEWMSSHDEKEKFYILESNGEKKYLFRDFICAVTVREV